jgi:hypothetical protein
MQQDYILREIERLGQVFSFVLQKQALPFFDKIEEDGIVTEESFLFYRLQQLLFDKKLNEAEDLLFEMIEENPGPEQLAAALEFYRTLSSMSEEELAACDFSKQEIAQGLSDLRKYYDQN